MTNVVRWGVIGLGRFGEVHARALSSMAGVELAALCTRNESRVSELAGEFGVGRTYRDYGELLADDSVDVVSIATHWHEHTEIALAALAAGKHVLLEKPMADTAADCRKILDAAEDAAGFLMVGHVCRFDARVTLAQEAIAAGRLGRIVSMHARRNLPRVPGPVRLDKISPLMGDGVHDADLMMWFTGALPSRVYGRTVRVDQFRYPDVGWAMLEFGDEAVGVVETVWCLPESDPYAIDARMEVIGSEGALYIDCANAGLAIHDKTGVHLPDTAYWPRQHGRIGGALARELSYFADCVRRGEPPQVITPIESARAVLVMEAAEESARSGQIKTVPKGV
jgi:UDP-N-acetylglucosamine 3-dehydrogenase